MCKKLSIDTEEVEEYNLKGFKTLLTFPKKKKRFQTDEFSARYGQVPRDQDIF